MALKEATWPTMGNLALKTYILCIIKLIELLSLIVKVEVVTFIFKNLDFQKKYFS